MDKTRSIGNMMNDRPELQKIDSWITLLKQSEIFKISNVFLGRKQNYDNMAVAAEVQSKITKDILSLSRTEKENIKQRGIVELLLDLIHWCYQRQRYRLFAWHNICLLDERNVSVVRRVKLKFP